MKRFLDFSTKWKLVTGFGAMILLLAVVSLTAYRTTVELRDSQAALFQEDFLVTADLIEIRSHMNHNRAAMLEALSVTDPSQREAAVREVGQVTGKIETLLQGLLKGKGLDESQKAKLRDFDTTREAYRRTRTEQIRLLRRGEAEAARELGLGLQDQRYDKMRRIALELADEERKQAGQRVSESARTVDATIRLFVIIGAAALALGIVTVWLLTTCIAGPLTAMTIVAERIASGDVSSGVQIQKRKDEVGVLSQMFGRMVETLQGTAQVAQQVAAGDLTVKVEPQSERDALGSALAAMLAALRDMTQQTLEGTNTLAASASEILAASSQLAAGATETATAVSQTTTTVEEVRQTAQVSTEKARQVSENAQQTQQVSDRGRTAAQETVDRMGGIREQMESIGDTVVRLSEQSQAIGQIIAVVDDIAEQSNLLAVNAAIEAAKAGEQGRGFAVVAQEIRSLAEQSKGATTQVRAILNDIQKATSAAVMATEQGSKAVESGLQQAAASGEAIRALAESVREAAQAAVQIAASSQQQMVGVEQVAMAMENIKQASGQNAASAGQLETEARGLHDLGARLKELVERYRL